MKEAKEQEALGRLGRDIKRWRWGDGMSDSLIQRPQTRLLLIWKNQICQQLGGGQAALVTGQRGKRRGGGQQLLELIEYLYLSKQQVSRPICPFVTCCSQERGATSSEQGSLWQPWTLYPEQELERAAFQQDQE